MSVKVELAGMFRSVLTLISPKLNTAVCYHVKFKRKLDWQHPVTLNDKILWLKFHTYWNNPTIKQCADKLRVRDYLMEHGFADLLNELIGVYYDVDDIDWASLPEQFAMKLNVGCACNIIVSDKSKLDIEAAKERMRKWLKSNYWLGWSEMQYKGVKPCILVERYLGSSDGVLPKDYKFYCMNGEAKYVMVCVDREIGKHAAFYYFDRGWNMMPYSEDYFKNPNRIIPKPDHIDEAFEIAHKLSKEFPFVRTDLYIVGDKVLFGEFTFTPSAGMDQSRLPETDRILGDQLILPMDQMEEAMEQVCSKSIPGNMLDTTASKASIAENKIMKGIIVGDKGFPESAAHVHFAANDIYYLCLTWSSGTACWTTSPSFWDMRASHYE